MRPPAPPLQLFLDFSGAGRPGQISPGHGLLEVERLEPIGGKPRLD
jgi:hypothetical protein